MRASARLLSPRARPCVVAIEEVAPSEETLRVDAEDAEDAALADGLGTVGLSVDERA